VNVVLNGERRGNQSCPEHVSSLEHRPLRTGEDNLLALGERLTV
jgi:hypothetical protein